MQRLHLRGTPPGLGIPLEGMHLVVETQLLEEPEDSIRARVPQVVDDQHDLLLPGLGEAALGELAAKPFDALAIRTHVAVADA